MNIKTKFKLKDTVYITELNCSGKIKSIYIDESGSIQYNIRYFVGADPKTVYFYEDELSGENRKELGFSV